MKVKYVDVLPELLPNQTILQRVISGGQRGADIAGIKAAKASGIKTGGHMPKGYITLDGVMPGYRWMYGMVDDTEPFSDGRVDYKTRTWKNVQEADATIRMALDFTTRGEQCTLNAIRHYKKPVLDVFMEPSWYAGNGDYELRIEPSQIAEWLIDNDVKTLNIAGNANRDLEVPIYFMLLRTFHALLWE